MLVSTVELAWRARKAGELGIRGSEGIGLDWAAVIARKNRLVAEWSEGKPEAFEEQRIAVLRGHARFLGPHEIVVDGRRITAERIVLAMGSSPARPPIERTATSRGLPRRAPSDRMVPLRNGA